MLSANDFEVDPGREAIGHNTPTDIPRVRRFFDPHMAEAAPRLEWKAWRVAVAISVRQMHTSRHVFLRVPGLAVTKLAGWARPAGTGCCSQRPQTASAGLKNTDPGLYPLSS
ncbi:uncharacterized protein PAN0_015c5204 [Moesziomyces antarcticus]|uniref:Uncharacterized protein n=1 Tax=Pseudozyma antarctica TaxID=84753 RepID=A0A081CJY3_PSEA2|nr:uncharacterized protein PAN0_015c5204 [Moesziomyces antarcticus]GAK66979.1 hypothetical protein PAN0_015c5204 [Moesziomyces antarcticus]